MEKHTNLWRKWELLFIYLFIIIIIILLVSLVKDVVGGLGLE